MSEVVTLRWREVRPLVPTNGDLAPVLATVDALRRAWQDAIAHASKGAFEESRRRSLRRHAIETGIIERLYDVDWGVTEALVAEGLTAEVAAREGGLDEDALATIRSQFDALSLLADAARDGTDLSISLIRQLHTAICRTQRSYTARNDLGQVLERPLTHGDWKKQANHVRRPDGSLLEYVPPEHVQSEMERLIALYGASSSAHPVVRAAWIHHALIGIHPFEDGNGRVARAVSLLVLLRHDYAPLVVDRFNRSDYIAALDRANEGSLHDLVRLFARLEIVALRSELERPAQPEAAGAGAVDVARAYVERLRSIRAATDTSKATRVDAFAREMHSRIRAYLDDLGGQMRLQFTQVDSDAAAGVYTGAPPDDSARWWRAQIIRAARGADFFVNLRDGTWWTHLRLKALGQTLRFVAVLQKVGHGETGVLALTVFAETLSPRENQDPDGEARPLPAPALRTTEAESATFIYDDDPAVRWPEVCGLLDRTVAAAIASFAEGLD
jgi:Fic family protein